MCTVRNRYDAANAAYSTFAQLLKDVAAEFGDGVVLILPSRQALKARERAEEKAKDSYEGRALNPHRLTAHPPTRPN